MTREEILESLARDARPLADELSICQISGDSVLRSCSFTDVPNHPVVQTSPTLHSFVRLSVDPYFSGSLQCLC